MDKMRMESIDMTSQNVDKIGAMFPNCITETNVGEIFKLLAPDTSVKVI